MSNSQESVHRVNFAPPRGFAATFKSHAKETLFPDDPFKQFKNEERPIKKAVQYFFPIFEWLPNYSSKLFRLGIVVDFLSHSTIVGFISGTAIIICLQQLKGIFGLTDFTTKTDVISVLHAVFEYRDEWKWESAVVGLIFLAFLLFTRYLKKRNPKLFWVSAIAPMLTVIVGGLFAYLAHAENHGIQVVGHLNRGINPLSIKDLNFESEYLPVTLKAGIITGILALAEGIAIGRSFAIFENYQTDGNKEMIAFGMMNIVGSLTSCYLTTGPFSKSAVNYNAGCRTAMSNIVMAICMMLTLLLLAPLFSYTPLVALSAIIMTAMFGLIEYEEAYRLFKVDKFDFCICMAAFFGVTFISMDIGLMMSIGLAILRALLYVARPATCKLGNMPDSSLYRDIQQYPAATGIPGILILKLGSPIYFANCSYLKERIMRWIRDEADITHAKVNEVEHLLLDIGGVSTIDMTGIETLLELRRSLEVNGIKMGIVNPRREVMEKMILSEFVDKVGRESFYLSIDEAVEACRFGLQESKVSKNDFPVYPTEV
ncbi:STAS domain-containing protein [Psidium guajava]|nr:STAS domain-containing protein [Psidium guajava]